MLILSNEDIEKILPVGACLDVLEEAYRDLGNGMAVSVGRLRPDALFDWKFVALSHNTVRGAAGAAILNAELMAAEGRL